MFEETAVPCVSGTYRSGEGGSPRDPGREKIAGEVQPLYREYFEREIRPQIDGKFIEYIGEADFQIKNELLANSLGLLFPIGWDEPFGLVMIEAMACGTPVLAFHAGSVPEVIEDGTSGYICASVDEMVGRIGDLQKLDPKIIRDYVHRNFSVSCMARKYVSLYSVVAGMESAGNLSEFSQTEHPVA